MKNIIRKKNSVVISLFVVLCFLIIPTLTFAQKLTHIVEKGDTLWDICEQYYGDSSLWPKLWEMNPFITNPHLLKAGDVITLFEKEPVKEEVKKVEAPPVEKAPAVEIKKEPQLMGIDVEALTEMNALGSFYTDKTELWGSIFASDKKNTMLAKGDTAYVIFDESRSIKTGDKFFIGRSSQLLEHPITRKDFGYIFNVKGILTIEERLGRAQKGDEYFEKKNVFRATINESYDAIDLKDALMPYKPVSSCILPVSVNKKTVGNIVASKDQRNLISHNSIVYIDLGYNDGLKKGNVLNVIKQKVVPDPAPEGKFFTSRSSIILPDNFIGRVMIVECGAGTSTGIVLYAVESISPGDYLKELTWEKMPDFLTALTECPIQ
jgi:hypothetical protein